MSTAEVSSEQLERLARAIYGAPADASAPAAVPEAGRVSGLVREMQSAVELQAFAELFNWEGGLAPRYEVLRHPACDDGTALMIYWDTRVFDRAADEVPEWERAAYELAIAIEERLCAGGFPGKSIRFDPKADRHWEWDHFFANARRELPSAVFEATAGEPVPPFDPSRLNPWLTPVGSRPLPSNPEAGEDLADWQLELGGDVIARMVVDQTEIPWTDSRWTYARLLDASQFNRFRDFFADRELWSDSPQFDTLLNEIKTRGEFCLRDLRTNQAYLVPRLDHEDELVWFRPDEPIEYPRQDSNL
ncbi:MAG TPA: DUF4274 domain-containing protein [Tepidisphaeraceae bacterium]